MTESKEIWVALWNNGIDLDAAAYQFGSPELKDALNQVRAAMGAPKEETSDALTVGTDAPWLEVLAVGMAKIQPAVAALNDFGDAWSRLRKHLIRAISLGHVVPVGFALPRTPGDTPISVPIDLWSRTIDWKASSVSGNGLEFVAVRVVSDQTARALMAEIDGAFSPKLKPNLGRPSVQREIFDAYISLKEQGLLDFSSSMACHYDLFRDWLCKQFPENSGQYGNLSNETIRRVISAEFKKDRDTNKQ
jgi:hypothetical protein